MLAADVEAVLEANQAFYDAFEARDIDAMSELWEHSDRVICTHPGWSPLRGWGAIAGSWFGLFGNTEHLQFIVTNARAEIDRDIAWVVCDENILGGASSGTVAALNLFSRRPGGRWFMIGHHGSPIVG
ncbi:MAG TPA: nuclear transport factor 2 family protein [Acidimicrobiales bacterium]|nr:nuclear transport factor 2 family protein [Acidimicrobiales bacterium]